MALIGATTESTLADLCAIAALTEEEKLYIAAKGLVSIRHFYRMFATEDEMTGGLVQAYTAHGGTTIGDVVHEATRPKELVKTSFLVLFDLVNEHIAAAKRQTCGQQSIPLANTAAQAASQGTPTLPTALSTARWLSAADWQSGVDAWCNQWTPPREFVVQELLGAEAVLARLRHEELNSKVYTPLLLTEVVAARVFKQDGSFNEARRSSAASSASSLELLATSLAKQFDVEASSSEKSQIRLSPFVVQDCLKANSWAQRWVGNASESDILEIEAFWTEILRNGSAEPCWSVFPRLYEAAGWRVAFSRRASMDSWAKVYREKVVKDRDWIDRELTAIKKTHAADRAKIIADQEEKQRNNRRRGSPPRPSERQRQRSRSRGTRIRMDQAEKERRSHEHDIDDKGIQICRNWNCGRCKRVGTNESGPGKACHFSHVCWTCRRPRCRGAYQCSQATSTRGNDGGGSGGGKGGGRREENRDDRSRSRQRKGSSGGKASGRTNR